MLWQWGQFVDHDIGLTEGAEPHESFDVLVPLGDPWFDPLSTGAMTIPVSRSAWLRDGAGVRQQVNDNTAFIDASHVYGSDPARAAALRAPFGRMAVSAGNLLPFNVGGFANAPSAYLPDFFLAGDVRANEQVGLIALHTVFVREHNWIVDQLEPLGLSGDALYEVARALVGAEMQVITYREFLPVLLGPDALRPYRGYRPDVDPQLANVFSTAVFRLGHTLLPSELLRLDASLQPVAAGPLPLRDAFFAPELVVAEGIDTVLRGLAVQPAQELDRFVVDDVRNFLFGQPGQGGFDLASLNVQRGRDHGLPSFNDVRRAFGLRRVQGFQELTEDRATRAALASVYGSIDLVDPWVGGLAEDHVRGAMVGRTFHRVLVDQFERLRDGDRFWYRAHLPPALLEWVEAQTLAAILRRNTGLGAEIRDRIFEVPASPASR